MSLAVCLDCRESSYFHTTMLCVFSNIIGGFILLHFNFDSEVPAEVTGYTSSTINNNNTKKSVCVCVCVCGKFPSGLIRKTVRVTGLVFSV